MWYFGKIKNSEAYGFDVFESTFEKYVELTDEEHDEIVEQAQKQGKWISGDKEGNPVLVDPPSSPKSIVNYERLRECEDYLKETDWYVLRYIDEGTPIPDDIKKQRHEAREEISGLRKSLEKEEK